ncbi:MAG: ABC transporter permease subunit, partial [Promethearchaeota archaeon]
MEKSNNNNSLTLETDVNLSLSIPSQEPKKFIIFLLLRFAGLIGLLLSGAIFIFIIVRKLPGDPWMLMIGDSPITDSKLAYIEALKQKWGFYEPTIVQFWYWIRNMLTGDWGESIILQKGRPVFDVINQRSPRTIEILTVSLLVALPIGVGLGILSGIKKGKWIDRIILGFAGVCFILPLTSIGIHLQYFFQDTIQHLILPCSVLAIGWTAILIIAIRRIFSLKKSKIMNFPTRNYIRTFLAFLYISMIAVRIETTFQLNGIGLLTVAAINTLDYFLLLALMLRQLFLFQLAAFTVDLIGSIIQCKINTKYPSDSTVQFSASADAHKYTFSDPSEPLLVNRASQQLSNNRVGEKPPVSWKSKSMLVRPGIILGGILLLFCIGVALSAPIFFSDKNAILLMDITAGNWAPPDDTHLLGTSKFGRDVLGRVLWGARIPILILFPISIVVGAVGYVLGFLCTGKITFLDKFVDFILKMSLMFPGIFVFLIYLSILGSRIEFELGLIGVFVFFT